MLREYHKIRQDTTGRRRWFEDNDLDLVVWYDDKGGLEGFQLLYWSKKGERALTWRPGTGFSHSRVDSGSRPTVNLTPVLVPDGVIPWEYLDQLFTACSEAIEPPLRDLVLARLKERE